TPPVLRAPPCCPPPALGAHRTGVPALGTPVAPSGVQKAPGVTTRGDVDEGGGGGGDALLVLGRGRGRRVAVGAAPLGRVVTPTPPAAGASTGGDGSVGPGGCEGTARPGACR